MSGSAAVPTGVSSVVRVIGGDPSASRVVYGAVGALLLIGVMLVLLAVWLVRQTRVDPELLAPLETMSDRKWRKLDPASQRRLLDDERPEGAHPLMTAPMQPSVDAEFESGEMPVSSFDDLVPVGSAPTGDVDGADESADDTDDLDRDSTDGMEAAEGGEDSAEDTDKAEDTDEAGDAAGDVETVDGRAGDADEAEDADEAHVVDEAGDEPSDLDRQVADSGHSDEAEGIEDGPADEPDTDGAEADSPADDRESDATVIEPQAAEQQTVDG